ncbi:MAG: hypothetical protein IH595_02315 [Bacteroidales bacterium]|nr:hypothetical protein [Bacteroidales bacterium]
MKKIFLLVFVSSLFLIQGCKRADVITLHVTVSNDVCQSGQWVYWFSVNANEYNIEDSVFLPKGHHSFTMKKAIPDMNEEMGCWLTFAKHGPQQAFLILNKGENVKLTINKKWITKTEGSPGTKNWYDFIGENLKIRSEMDSLTHVLVNTKDSLTRKYLNNRINTLNDSLQFKLKLAEFNKIKTPKMFLLELTFPGLPKKTVDSLVTVMKHRFPDNKRVQEYPSHPKYPPPTAHSKWVQKRLLQIWTQRTGFNYEQPVSKLSAEQKKRAQAKKVLDPEK